MSDVICITSRALVKGSFLDHLAAVAAAKPRGIILREKEMLEEDYLLLAQKVQEALGENRDALICHTYVSAARQVGCHRIHLPIYAMRKLRNDDRAWFTEIGVSTHSAEEAVEAQQLGATHVTAGHIFATECKAGVSPRGLDFLRDICNAVSIPVYAVGGITPANAELCYAAGAAGVCVMSGIMTAADPAAYLAQFKEKEETND
jgi:thiamine-phosphate pyrophosphorylase